MLHRMARFTTQALCQKMRYLRAKRCSISSPQNVSLIPDSESDVPRGGAVQRQSDRQNSAEWVDMLHGAANGRAGQTNGRATAGVLSSWSSMANPL